MYQPITSIHEFNLAIEQNEAALFYFSHEQCNVCKVLKPKVAELIEKNFQNIKLFYCDTITYPDLAAQNSIFAVPTLSIYFTGKEFIRKSRNLGIEELAKVLERPYDLLFG
jgi:thioredoxin-like negative regulator of GroEL